MEEDFRKVEASLQGSLGNWTCYWAWRAVHPLGDSGTGFPFVSACGASPLACCASCPRCPCSHRACLGITCSQFGGTCCGCWSPGRGWPLPGSCGYEAGWPLSWGRGREVCSFGAAAFGDCLVSGTVLGTGGQVAGGGGGGGGVADYDGDGEGWQEGLR